MKSFHLLQTVFVLALVLYVGYHMVKNAVREWKRIWNEPKVVEAKRKDFDLAMIELRGALDEFKDIPMPYCSPAYVACCRVHHAVKLLEGLP